MTADQSEAIQAARRWVLMQLALIRDPHSARSASDAADAAFRQTMGQSHPGWDANGSEAPYWAAYWEADQQAVNAYAAAMIATGNAKCGRVAQLEVAPDAELLEMARENLKGYQHSYPRPTTADSILVGIDSRIRSAASVSEYYDQFRDDEAECQIAVLEKMTNAALIPKDEANYDRAAIFDFAAGLITRLKDGGYYRDNVHREVAARISNSLRPKGRPGNKPSVRDPLFLALVQEVIRRFGIPAERNDRGRQDGAVYLVGAIIDEVFLPLRGGLRHGTGLVNDGDKPAAVKIWERHRNAQKG